MTRKRPRPSSMSFRTYWMSTSLRRTEVARVLLLPADVPGRRPSARTPRASRARRCDETEATMTAIAAGEQVRRGRVPEPVDVVVPRAVLLDVEVGLRDVGLGLVVVVVGDEVLDRVVREELAELVAELRGERLVEGDDQRRPADLLDDPGHRRGLPGAGRAEEGLVALAGRQPRGEGLDRRRLVAGRPVIARRPELCHRPRVSTRSAYGHGPVVARDLAGAHDRSSLRGLCSPLTCAYEPRAGRSVAPVEVA